MADDTHEEDGEQADRGLEGSEHEQEGEHEPGDEVDTESGLELSRCVVGGEDARVGPVDESERDPEGSVGGERGRSEGVSGCKLESKIVSKISGREERKTVTKG